MLGSMSKSMKSSSKKKKDKGKEEENKVSPETLEKEKQAERDARHRKKVEAMKDQVPEEVTKRGPEAVRVHDIMQEFAAEWEITQIAKRAEAMKIVEPDTTVGLAALSATHAAAHGLTIMSPKKSKEEMESVAMAAVRRVTEVPHLKKALVLQQSQNTAAYKIFMRMYLAIFFWFLTSTIWLIYSGQHYFTSTLPSLRDIYFVNGGAARIEAAFDGYVQNQLIVPIQSLANAIALGAFDEGYDLFPMQLVVLSALNQLTQVSSIELAFQNEEEAPVGLASSSTTSNLPSSSGGGGGTNVDDLSSTASIIAQALASMAASQASSSSSSTFGSTSSGTIGSGGSSSGTSSSAPVGVFIPGLPLTEAGSASGGTTATSGANEHQAFWTPLTSGGIRFRRIGENRNLQLESDLYPPCIAEPFACSRNLSVIGAPWHTRLGDVYIPQQARLWPLAQSTSGVTQDSVFTTANANSNVDGARAGAGSSSGSMGEEDAMVMVDPHTVIPTDPLTVLRAAQDEAGLGILFNMYTEQEKLGYTPPALAFLGQETERRLKIPFELFSGITTGESAATPYLCPVGQTPDLRQYLELYGFVFEDGTNIASMNGTVYPQSLADYRAEYMAMRDDVTKLSCDCETPGFTLDPQAGLVCPLTGNFTSNATVTSSSTAESGADGGAGTSDSTTAGSDQESTSGSGGASSSTDEGSAAAGSSGGVVFPSTPTTTTTTNYGVECLRSGSSTGALSSASAGHRSAPVQLSEQYEGGIYTEWETSLPQRVSPGDTQVALDSTQVDTVQTISLLFKLPMVRQAGSLWSDMEDVQDAGIVTAPPLRRLPVEEPRTSSEQTTKATSPSSASSSQTSSSSETTSSPSSRTTSSSKRTKSRRRRLPIPGAVTKQSAGTIFGPKTVWPEDEASVRKMTQTLKLFLQNSGEQVVEGDRQVLDRGDRQLLEGDRGQVLDEGGRREVLANGDPEQLVEKDRVHLSGAGGLELDVVAGQRQTPATDQRKLAHTSTEIVGFAGEQLRIPDYMLIWSVEVQY
ncbi:unnamed protein product [Amoebophrya sp. A25]|nr:unnamed protein product [Amoebophrya sp. A25]|eukprot:GSA25T00018400001.1